MYRIDLVSLVAILLGIFCFESLGHGAELSGRSRDLVSTNLVPENFILFAATLGSNHPAENRSYAVIVEKQTQTLRLYSYDKFNKFTIKQTFPCSTGKVVGRKVKEGDKKTPEGVYVATKMFTQRYLAPQYGSRAFVLDYPNFKDVAEGRGGSDIWLHGTDEPLEPRNSRGCVVLENNDIDELAKVLRLNWTPIIIVDRIRMVDPNDVKATQRSAMTMLNRWRRAFINGWRLSFERYYLDPDAALDGNWAYVRSIVSRWRRAKVPFNIEMRDVSLIGIDDYIVAIFSEWMAVENCIERAGTRKLFLKHTDNRWRITDDNYLFSHEAGSATVQPAVATLERLEAMVHNGNVKLTGN